MQIVKLAVKRILSGSKYPSFTPEELSETLIEMTVLGALIHEIAVCTPEGERNHLKKRVMRFTRLLATTDGTVNMILEMREQGTEEIRRVFALLRSFSKRNDSLLEARHEETLLKLFKSEHCGKLIGMQHIVGWVTESWAAGIATRDIINCKREGMVESFSSIVKSFAADLDMSGRDKGYLPLPSPLF